jgi:hypothetical protein
MKGYIRLPIFMTSSTGVIIETEAEAYIVPGMSVPILLGEDYQSAYELSIFRNVESGSRIRFGGTSFNIPAVGVSRSNDSSKVRKSALGTESFLRAKTHQRDKARRHRNKLHQQAATRLIRAVHDSRIPTHTVKRVDVEGNFADKWEWLVEKILLSGLKDKYFAIPNTLISSSNSFVPIANTTDVPRYIRRGETIGEIVDPTQYFNRPQTLEQLNKYVEGASQTTALITADKPPSSLDEKPALFLDSR